MQYLSVSGVQQEANGTLYMQLRERTTKRIKQIIVPLVTAREPFDMRPASGHLWLWQENQYVAQKCHSGCSVCNG